MISNSVAGAIANEDFERRLLARQLELLSAPARGAVVGTPLWAVAVVWIMSGAFPALGQVPLARSMPWLAAVIAVCLVCLWVETAYRKAKADPTTVTRAPTAAPGWD